MENQSPFCTYTLRLQSWNGAEVLTEYRLMGSTLPSFPDKTAFRVGDQNYTPLSYEYDLSNRIITAKIRNESDEWWNDLSFASDQEIILENGRKLTFSTGKTPHKRWIDEVSTTTLRS